MTHSPVNLTKSIRRADDRRSPPTYATPTTNQSTIGRWIATRMPVAESDSNGNSVTTAASAATTASSASARATGIRRSTAKYAASTGSTKRLTSRRNQLASAPGVTARRRPTWMSTAASRANPSTTTRGWRGSLCSRANSAVRASTSPRRFTAMRNASSGASPALSRSATCSRRWPSSSSASAASTARPRRMAARHPAIWFSVSTSMLTLPPGRRGPIGRPGCGWRCPTGGAARRAAHDRSR